MKNLFFELTVKSLKNNKIRTLATLIGVVISVTLITNIIFTSSSLYNFMVKDIKSRFGDWSVQIENIQDTVKDKTDNMGLDKGIMTGISYACIEGGVNPDKPFIYVTSMDDRMQHMTDFQLLEGRMPKNKDEIVIPEHLLTNGGIKHEIGDKINLDEGSRVSAISGKELTQLEPYVPDEENFVKVRNKDYKVVGISKRMAVEPYMAAGYMALTIEQQPVINVENIFFHSSEFEKVSSIISKDKISQRSVLYNEALLKAQGKIPGESNIKNMILMSILLICFIGICGYLLMYNAFTFSLLEHTKAYRTLVSVGATEKQLRKASLYEGIFISIIGIPVGMIIGALATLLLIHFWGSNIISMFTFYSDGVLKYQVGSKWIITDFIVANLMVILSILLPAYRTGKTKPVSRVQYQFMDDEQSKRGSSDIMKKGLLSIEGKLALKNFKKNKRTYRYPIVSMTLSIVLFISAGTLGTYMEKMMEIVQGPDSSYDIAYISQSAKEAEKAFVQLSTVEGVEECSHIKYANFPMEMDGKEQDTTLYIIDDENFKKHLEVNDINPKGYFNKKNPKAVALSYVTTYNSWKNTFEKQWLDTEDMELWDEGNISGIDKPLKISNYIDKLPKESSLEVDSFIVLMSESAADGHYVKDGMMKFDGCAYFKVKDNSKTYSIMEKICKDNGLGVDYLINMEKERDNIKSTVMVIKLMSYTFIILISIIAAVNIFNTISSNMSLRQLEFATLLSIGMSEKSLDKMIYIECILIGVKTLLYALPLTEIGLYLIFKNSSLNSVTGYIFPWSNTILSIVILFITVGAIMTYGTYKVHQRDSSTILKNFKD